MPRADQDERLAYSRAYRHAHPERVKAWERQKWANVKSDPVRHARHRRLATQRMAEWRASNPERSAEAYARHRARQKALGYPNARASYRRHRGQNVARVIEYRKRTGYSWAKTHRESVKTYARTPAGRFNAAKVQARVRGIGFALSRDEFTSLLNHKCVYCGADRGGHTGSGLDRIDNSQGYTMGNVVPCCGPCNRIRGTDLSHGEMLAAMRAVLEYRDS